MSSIEDPDRSPSDKSPIMTWAQLARIVILGTALSAVFGAVASAGFLYANFSDNQVRQKEDLGKVWSVIADVRSDVRGLQGSLDSITRENIGRDSRIQSLHENYLAAAEALTRLSATMAQTIQLTDSKVDSLLSQTNDLKVAVARIETAVKYGGKSENNTPGH